ncbi:MAG: hypothetical protein D3924_10630 [Candidatus Electrothrix sp. AR4]|nr:hypothetical protein [Candidatus Electrothrix sp. AR4]
MIEKNYLSLEQYFLKPTEQDMSMNNKRLQVSQVLGNLFVYQERYYSLRKTDNSIPIDINFFLYFFYRFMRLFSCFIFCIFIFTIWTMTFIVFIVQLFAFSV